MGFQGTLNSVNLGDIFQTLAMNRQTGTLSVRHPSLAHHLYFIEGEIAMCDQSEIEGRPGLLTILIHRGFLSKPQAEELASRAGAGTQPIRELILASGDVIEQDLDLICNTVIEEVVCDIFEWHDGDFIFTDGQPVMELANPHIIELGAIRMQTAGVVMEATRRVDEWRRIREIITNEDELYIVDNEGRANLNKIETDQDVLKVLRYLDGRHRLKEISTAISMSRFDVFAIVSQLILNGIARTRSEQEIVSDALEMRSEGNKQKARELLESALERARMVDIMRPLAELCVELNDIPRAVELYLELIQNEQDDGEVETALADLETVIRLSPDDPELQIDRAEMLFELGNTDEAAETYLKAADAYLNSRNIEEALTACHRAKDLNHLSPTPHRYLAKAYILDGQTESALVEYKSLWHTLLSSMRPRKAMDQLQSILENDCKVASLKENVMSYAKGSDAVKTGSALRMLVYLIILAALGFGGWKGWEFYQKEVVLASAQKELSSIKTEFDSDPESASFQSLINRASKLQGDDSFNQEVSSFIKKVKDQNEQVGKKLVSAITVDLQNRKFKEAKTKLAQFQRTCSETKIHTEQYEALKSQYEIAEAKAGIKDDLEKLDALWADQDWDEAITGLSKLTLTEGLPASVEDELKAKLNEWEDQNRKSASLYKRAETIESSKSLRDALVAYKRALQGEGSKHQELAKNKISKLEEDLAENINTEIDKSLELGDNTKVLSLINELKELSENSRASKPKLILQKRTLPITLDIDHHLTEIIITDDGRDRTYRAPEGLKGPWKKDTSFPALGQITVKAKRPGFSEFVKVHKINENDIENLTSININLKRGPLWVAQLDGKPVTTPVLAGNLILVGTNKNTLSLVNSVGKTSPIDLKADVSVFSGAPFVFNRTAYAVIGDRLYAIDLNTRSILWTYPDDKSAEFAGQFVQSVWVQEHAHKASDLQVIVGTREGNVIMLEVDPDNNVIAYPKTSIGWAATAAPLSFANDPTEKRIIYLPAGNRIVTFDSSTATAGDPLEKVYDMVTRGEVLCRPTPAIVAGTSAILVTDSTGFMTALNSDPDSQRGNQDAIGSWPLEGGAIFEPVVIEERNMAICGLSEGSVIAIDLKKPGQVLWRFPEEGNLGSINGKPAIGKNGVYVADSTGNLSCIDLTTGKQKWKVDLLSAANTGVLAHEGRIYVGTRAGSLLCLEEGLD